MNGLTGWLWVILGAVVVAVFGVLWATIGGAAMAILFGAVFWLASVALAYALGRSHEAEAMGRGASIALKAQVSDDRRDMAQMTVQFKMFKEIAGLMRQVDQSSGLAGATYPPMPMLPGGSGGSGQIVDGDFRIDGLDDDEDNVQ